MSATQLFTYDQTKKRLKAASGMVDGPVVHCVASLAASLTLTTAICPLDVIYQRTRASLHLPIISPSSPHLTGLAPRICILPCACVPPCISPSNRARTAHMHPPMCMCASALMDACTVHRVAYRSSTQRILLALQLAVRTAAHMLAALHSLPRAGRSPSYAVGCHYGCASFHPPY